MNLRNLEILKRIVSKKKSNPSIQTMKTGMLINPLSPRHGGKDVTSKLNESYHDYLSKYYL